MNKLCCIPCNETPEIKVNLTCTCCASTHIGGVVCNHKIKNDNESDINTSVHNADISTSVHNAIDRTCKSCCCRCKKLRKRQRQSNQSDNDSNSEQ